jgi:hypothetical protein
VRQKADLAGLMRIQWLGCLAFEADGTLWSGSGDGWGGGGLVRYVGGEWELVDPRAGGGQFIVTDLAVVPNGDLWVVGADDVAWVLDSDGTVTHGFIEHWVARFDGSGWEVRTEAESPVARPTSNLTVAPDGSIWVGTADGLARLDGASWSVVLPGVSFNAVSVAPDGTVWVVSPSGVGRLTEVSAP